VLQRLIETKFETKPLDDFYKAKDSRDGHKAYCKKCGLSDSKQYLNENFDSVSEYQRKHYGRNRIRRLEQVIKWGSKNREKQRLYKKKYSDENPEVALASRHRRRARLKGGKTEKFFALEIFERDNWICALCKNPIDKNLKAPNPMSVSLDHTKPIAKGGGHTRENVQTAHLSCNQKKSAKYD